MAQTGFPLPLRNALAELTIAALDDDEASAALAWLARGSGRPAPAAVPRLAAVHLLDDDGSELLEVHRPWTEAVRAHAGRAEAAAIAHRLTPHTGVNPVDVAIVKAAALWAERLFFEVHEVLEAEWKRTGGEVRTALQGLIQIGVAFHHLGHGNLRGARSLFRDGRERLAASAAAVPLVDTDALLAATAVWGDATATGVWPGELPPLPLRPAT